MAKDAKAGKPERKTGMGFKKKRGRPCFFCENKVNLIDYKDLNLLQRFQSPRGKIQPRRQSSCCSKHQRKLAEAVKRARLMCLLPFVTDLE